MLPAVTPLPLSFLLLNRECHPPFAVRAKIVIRLSKVVEQTHQLILAQTRETKAVVAQALAQVEVAPLPPKPLTEAILA